MSNFSQLHHLNHFFYFLQKCNDCGEIFIN
nr:MAG TPA: Rubredoxin-like zinc ribbon domain protein [Caudoviricetes sp.]